MIDHADRCVAVVGCGYWGKNLVRNFAGLRALRWICDEDDSALDAQKEVAPGVGRTQSFQEVLADDQVKGVVIATPAGLHFSQARQALEAGKDVFVEKPLALRYAEGKELVDLARERKAVLMVGHILDYHPAVVLLKKVVHDGELGKVRYIYSTRLNLGKVRQVENILWSFAPHDISIIIGLLDEAPSSVRAMGGNYLQKGIADVTLTTLEFPSGASAHTFVSWLHPYKEQKLVVVGDQKMAVFDDTLPDGKLKVYDKGIDWETGRPVTRQVGETVLYHDRAEPLRLECAHFLECIRTRSSPVTDGEVGLRVLKVLEDSQTSLERNGTPISSSEGGGAVEDPAGLPAGVGR